MLTKQNILVGLLCALQFGALAHAPTNRKHKPQPAALRMDCAHSLAYIDQEINNVRARLLAGGDCWWDLEGKGRYIVPKVDLGSGEPEVSSMSAAAVWLGGRDPGGSLKLACQQYRTSKLNDFWSGPLDTSGRTEYSTCNNWDRHFRVTSIEIRQHINNIKAGNRDPDAIPKNIKGWPARDNKYFDDIWGFSLQATPQGLASFYDVNGDGGYDPLEGDYPALDIQQCDRRNYPDEMIFWVYNDEGGGATHSNTKGNAIQIEVQALAFSYVSNDDLDNMTFQQYKIINRATEYIDSMYFAFWADPDLGCAADDYVGCDTTLGLMYVYNKDSVDGYPDNNCDGIPTYGLEIPMIGIDFMRGPLQQVTDGDGNILFDRELGMTSFTIITGNNAAPGMEDPNGANEYYNCLKGLRRDGQPYIGTNGKTKFLYPSPPDDPNGWSMVTSDLPGGDFRTIQSSGPFRLNPGAVNELIIGVPWVPNIKHPKPNLSRLLYADKLAQRLFDGCFHMETPDAPFIDWVEMDRQLVAVLSYPDSSNTNNYNLSFEWGGMLVPDGTTVEQTTYRFEGYKIYQLVSPYISSTVEIENNTNLSRLVANVDLKNGIKKVYNWSELENPVTGTQYFKPELKAVGDDTGIKNTFNITEDRFASGNDKRLINHKKYYFVAIAYAYSNYEGFDPYILPATGQQIQYISSRRAGYGTGQITPFTVIPRPVVDQVLNAAYGQSVAMTRLQGAGVNGSFLDLTDASRASLWNWPAGQDTILDYKEGRGPIEVFVFNPFEVKDGDYEIELMDDTPNDNKLTDSKTYWILRRAGDLNVIRSARSIADLNEQIVKEYGFSVNIGQASEPGKNDPGNGAIGAEVTYVDPNNAWLTGNPVSAPPFNYFNQFRDAFYDSKRDLVNMGNGWFVPYALSDWDLPDDSVAIKNPRTRLFTPAWTEDNNEAGVGGTQNARLANLARLPNVDIVFTADTSKWSRCMVIESASRYYTDDVFPEDPALGTQSPSYIKRAMFDLRYAPSVGKSDLDGDGYPDRDFASNPTGLTSFEIPTSLQGQPMRGMGWFPGYAIDVETGRRLNIFFGENSCYDASLDNNAGYTGRDMLFNPTNQMNRGNFLQDYWNILMGGQHFVYVMSTTYDGCEAARRRFTPEFSLDSTSRLSINARKIVQIKNIAWAGMLMTAPGYEMKSLKNGLIPQETVVKLRVTNKYQTWWNEENGSTTSKGNPKYKFKIEGLEVKSRTLTTNVLRSSALDSIKVVPNPYYAYPQYEPFSLTNTVKITNLPAVCNVTIYTLNGEFVRQYNLNDTYAAYHQILPALDWDLTNAKGVPIASGVYLIRVTAPGFGERTLKWFGICR